MSDEYDSFLIWKLSAQQEINDYREERNALRTENAKLRELVEHLQPIDCEGNVLDIADTVSMLRSEYDGDHEWDDVVVELVLTKWGGDRWIVRGSKGEAWACDCLKTGYDEDAYEGSDDAEPIVNPSLIEAENAKLRELVDAPKCEACEAMLDCDECLRADGSHKERRRLSAENAKLREAVATAIKVQAVLCGDADSLYCRNECPLHRQESDDCLACDVIGVAQELGIEVPDA